MGAYGNVNSKADAPENFVFVSSSGDFPAAVGGVITLAADTTYYITKTVDLGGDRLVGGSNTVIVGGSSENSILTSTGLGAGVALLTSIYTTPIRHIAFKDVDTAIDFDGVTNPGEAAIDWTGVNFVNIPNIGSVKDVSNFIFDKGAFLSSKGLVFDGTIGTVGFGNSLFVGDGNSGSILTIAATANITRRFRIIYSSVVAFGPTVGIDFNQSATIGTEGYILDTVNFSGGGTYLTGVDTLSNKALSINNKGVSNTREASQYFMNGNATTTVINSAGVAVKVAGATTSGAATQKFTNIDNRATYEGVFVRYFNATATLSIESGNNDRIGVYFAKNQSLITESENYVTMSGVGDAQNVTVHTLVQLEQNDYLEVFVENDAATTDILVTDLNVIIE